MFASEGKKQCPSLPTISSPLRPLSDASRRFQPHGQKDLARLEPPGGVGGARSGSTGHARRQSIEERNGKSERSNEQIRGERERSRASFASLCHLSLSLSPLSLSRRRAHSEASKTPSLLCQTLPLHSYLTSRNAWACRGSAKVTKAKPLPSITARSESAPNLAAYSRSASAVVPSGMPPMKSVPPAWVVCCRCRCLGFFRGTENGGGESGE